MVQKVMGQKACIIIFVLCVLANTSYAQIRPADGFNKRKAFNSHTISMPPYGLNKIDSLLALPRSHDIFRKLTSSDYNLLTLKEKFTYSMLYPETYSQICSIITMRDSEDTMLFAFLTPSYSEFNLSERQNTFLEQHIDSVIALLKECIINDGHIGLNFKNTIVNINALKLIPLIITTYKFNRNDHDMLTMLMLLMKKNGYNKFTATTLYNTLYNSAASNYKMRVTFDYVNEGLILQLATDFYNEYNH